MTHHLHLHVERETLVRANVAVTLTLIWGGLAACAVAAAIYDIGHWINAW